MTRRKILAVIPALRKPESSGAGIFAGETNATKPR